MVALLVLLLVLPAAALSAGHPHGPDSEVYFSGTIKQVDRDARTLTIDAVDPRSLTRRDVVVSLDEKVTIRRGKVTITLADLEAGQRATCVGFRELDDGDRIVLTDVRVSDRRR